MSSNGFCWIEFSNNNDSLYISENTKTKKKIRKSILGSDLMRFQLEKECLSLQTLINKLFQHNQLFHAVLLNESNLNNKQYLEMIVLQLSKYSLSLSSQILVIQIACDILQELDQILNKNKNKNELRTQCIGYQCMMTDIKEMCTNYKSKYFEVWGEWYNENNLIPVLNKMDIETSFIMINRYIQNHCQYTYIPNDIIKICHQFYYIKDYDDENMIFDIFAMKQSRISECRQRILYIDVKNKILKIHDPTIYGKNKRKTIISEKLIKKVDYFTNQTYYDHISIAYYKTTIGKNKKHFHCLVDKYDGHRFIALMKTYVAPSKISNEIGSFSVEQMSSDKLIDLELPNRFPIGFMIHLLQQKYVQLSLMEKWCWSLIDSLPFMTDSSICNVQNLKMKKRKEFEALIKAFYLILKFHGFELITSCSEQLVPPIIWALVPSISQYLHECWLHNLQNDGWVYSINHSFQNKSSPWIVDWTQLSRTGKNLRIQQAIVLIKGTVTAGWFFKLRETKR